MSIAVALAAAAATLALLRARRGPPRRLVALVCAAGAPGGSGGLGRPGPLPPRARRAARVLAGLVAVAWWPPALAVLVAWWWIAPRLRARRDERRRQAVVVAGLPDVLDLAALALGAGLTVPLAVRTLAQVAAEPFRSAFAEATRRADRGQRLADALDVLPHTLGGPLQPLVAALAATERYGVPVGATLDRLALDARRERRRQADVAARRLPVRLSFPLVCCILPAFGLLTLAPLLAGAFGSLQ